MGLKYQIETYDVERAELPKFLIGLPEFLHQETETFHLGTNSSTLVTVTSEPDYVKVCLHVASRDTDALLGLIIRHLLTVNDHVVLSNS